MSQINVHPVSHSTVCYNEKSTCYMWTLLTIKCRLYSIKAAENSESALQTYVEIILLNADAIKHILWLALYDIKQKNKTSQRELKNWPTDSIN